MSDDEILLGADGEGMHRRAIFFSEITDEDGKFKVKASCMSSLQSLNCLQYYYVISVICTVGVLY